MAVKDKYINIALTLTFFLVAWGFWSFLYPQSLFFQEQLQIFLFDEEFFLERIAMPAGGARYIAEFLVQMYSSVLLGGAIIASIYVLMQLSVWQLVCKTCKTKTLGYVLTFVPSLLLWLCMGNVSTKLTLAVALLLALVAMMLYPAAKKQACRYLYALIAAPVLSWLAGPVVLLFMLYVIVCEAKVKNWLLAAFTFVVGMASAILPSHFAPVPLYRIFYGINYSLDITEFPTMPYAIMISILLLVAVIPYLPSMQKRRETAMSVCIASAAAVMMFVAVPKAFDEETYEVLRYDMYVRSQNWDKLIAAADKKRPETPLTVAMLNLSLAMKGSLNERAFGYYQNGWGGAFPAFNKHYMVSMVTAETYFYLGLCNSAQRMAFEAMEALPDNTKSVRCILRLAETNLINGEYTVARKYLLLLQKTMFYRAWATRTMALLDNDKAVEAHPLYGYLRSLHLKDDFTFSEQEIDKIMGQLVMVNHSNTLAIQYLLLLPQLEGDRAKYEAYRQFVNSIR